MRYVLDLMSDSHMFHKGIVSIPAPELGESDVWVYLHAGDYSYYGRKDETLSFATWLGEQKHHQKIVIPGNHECFCDPAWVRWKRMEMNEHSYAYSKADRKACVVTEARDIFSYYGVEYVTWDFVDASGLKIYCDPYSLEFFDWAFMLKHEDAEKHWKAVQRRVEDRGEGLDVVLTHGPPKGILDACPALSDRNKMVHVGDPALLRFCEETEPLLCVFGHIHESRGIQSVQRYDPPVAEGGLYVPKGRTTTYVNASYVDGQYEPTGRMYRVWVKVENGEKRITKLEEIDLELA